MLLSKSLLNHQYFTILLDNFKSITSKLPQMNASNPIPPPPPLIKTHEQRVRYLMSNGFSDAEIVSEKLGPKAILFYCNTAIMIQYRWTGNFGTMYKPNIEVSSDPDDVIEKFKKRTFFSDCYDATSEIRESISKQT